VRSGRALSSALERRVASAAPARRRQAAVDKLCGRCAVPVRQVSTTG
jgi:hypothetical protein